MTNEVIRNIITRRSCKKFKSDPVPQEMIDAVVEAGLYAASGMGKQSPIIIVVTDRMTRDKLSELNAKYDPMKRSDPFYNAPVVIPVLADKTIITHVYDGSLVLGNMMLAAHSLGLGSCWIHRAKEVFEDKEGQEILKRLGIFGEYEGIGNLVLGYPEILNSNIPARKENRVFRI
ncbi:MAG TPA: nitroreductase family protein [Clostridiaceae bacterium]|nr:nitroreductase family protein [Clostridiaceae bacterium]